MNYSTLVGKATSGRRLPDALSLAAIVVGTVLGFVHSDPRSALVLGLLLVMIGGALTWAFRTSPGPLTRLWQRSHRVSDARLYRFYAVAGPWAWRLGGGMVLGGLVSAMTAS